MWHIRRRANESNANCSLNTLASPLDAAAAELLMYPTINNEINTGNEMASAVVDEPRDIHRRAMRQKLVSKVKVKSNYFSAPEKLTRELAYLVCRT